MKSKICYNCKKDKPASEWHISKKSSDGLSSYCKECRKEKKINARKNKKGYYENESHLNKLKNISIKTKVMEQYCSGIIKCAKCGFLDIRALSIDHINGGGTFHRQIIKNTYKWLIDNNFPTGFQVLCMNCQFIKRHENNEWFKRNTYGQNR